jgi:hypothetical protein
MLLQQLRSLFKPRSQLYEKALKEQRRSLASPLFLIICQQKGWAYPIAYLSFCALQKANP